MFVGEFVGAGIVRGGSGRVAVLKGPRPSGKALARSLARRWRGARKFLATMRLRHAEASTAAAIMRARALVKLLGEHAEPKCVQTPGKLGSTWGERAGETLGVDLG